MYPNYVTLCFILNAWAEHLPRFVKRKEKFSYGVTNQCETFIYLNLINREVSIKRYFK
jgi:hypothetical protein